MGDPGEPLIPAIAGLTSTVLDRLKTGPSKDAIETLLRQLANDGETSPNVETILSTIRDLRRVAGSGTVRDLRADELKGLETKVTEAIAEKVSADLPDADGPYTQLATWIGGTARDHPITVFTTNYDTLLEQALERASVPFFDGFVGSVHPFLDVHAMEVEQLPARWARVWKLHGSVLWSAASEGHVVRRVADRANAGALIHPSHLKYEQSRRMPYLAMFDRLRAFLRLRAATLVTVGYSFNDEHLNETIEEGLRGNPNAMAFGLLYESLEAYPMANEIALRRPNLALLARDSGVVGTTEVAAATEPENPSPNLGDFSDFGRVLAAQSQRRTATRDDDHER